MNPSKLMTTFVRNHNRPSTERQWINGVFTVLTRVARRNAEFTVDEVWAEIDKAYEKGTIREGEVDHRTLGPMLLHMAHAGLISSTGYYVKSTRIGGGSRPVTVWRSHTHSRARVAA